MKANLLQLCSQMGVADFMQLACAKSFIETAMADETRSKGASPPPIAVESLMPPNWDWEPGKLLMPYCFSSKSGNSVKDEVLAALSHNSDKPTSITVNGNTISVKSNATAISVTDMTQRSI